MIKIIIFDLSNFQDFIPNKLIESCRVLTRLNRTEEFGIFAQPLSFKESLNFLVKIPLL